MLQEHVKAEMERRSRKLKRRRVRHDIIIATLEPSRHGELKSHIMEKVNLKFQTTRMLLESFVIQEFY